MANIRRRGNSFQITVSLGYDSEMKKFQSGQHLNQTYTQKKETKIRQNFAKRSRKFCQGI